MHATFEQVHDLLVVRLHDDKTGEVLHTHHDSLPTTSMDEARRQALLIVQAAYDSYEETT